MSKVEIEWEPQVLRPAARPGMSRTAIEYRAQGIPIFECRECALWEAHVDVVDGEVIVREWHKADCSIAAEMRVDLARCHDALAPGYYCSTCGMYTADEPKD